MSDTPVMPPTTQDPWGPDPGRPRRERRWLKVAVGVGAAAGVAVGATALAQAATSSGVAPPAGTATATASGSQSTTTVPSRPHRFGGPGRGPGGGFGGFAGPGLGGPGLGGPGLGGGSFLYGQFTVQGPNGYETISERTGSVSTVTDTAGSTWSLTVKSADGSSGTFTVDTDTSVNGGEMGIGSVKTGDTVRVTAVVSGGTSTAKTVLDETVLKANGGTWQPMRPPSGSTGGPGTGSATPSPQSATPPV